MKIRLVISYSVRGEGDEEAVRFREAVLTDTDIQAVQVRVRQRVLRWFARQGYLD